MIQDKLPSQEATESHLKIRKASLIFFSLGQVSNIHSSAILIEDIPNLVPSGKPNKEQAGKQNRFRECSGPGRRLD